MNGGGAKALAIGILSLCDWAVQRPYLVLAAAVICIMAPSLVLGVGAGHDLNVHYLRTDQFPDVLARGELYPRWLPQVRDGLGSPTFYFYPPLAYYVCAIIDFITFRMLTTQHALAVAFAVLLFASGATMFLWLRRFAPPALALAGAAGFVIAPYHVFADHYIRAAFAEFSSFLFLPLVAMALHDVAKGARWGIAKLAIFYAGLIYSHMPTTLLVTIFLIAPYAVFLLMSAPRERRIRFLLSALFAGVCGMALAAPYLLPAMSLQHFISPEMWDIYSTQNFIPIQPDRWPASSKGLMLGYIFLTLGWLALMAGIARVIMQSKIRNPELVFWIALTAVCALLVLGLPHPAFWNIPIINRVQFSWRLMTIVEFAGITTLIMSAGLLRKAFSFRFVQAGLAAGLLGALALGALSARNVVWTMQRGDETFAAFRAEEFDAPEFLPSGFWAMNTTSAAAIAQPPLTSPGARATLIEMNEDRIRIEADPSQASAIVVRRFYFPSWIAVRERDGAEIATRPQAPFQFISFDAEPGETYTIQRIMLPVEKLAWIIAAIGAALSAAQIAFSRFGGALFTPNSTASSRHTYH